MLGASMAQTFELLSVRIAEFRCFFFKIEILENVSYEFVLDVQKLATCLRAPHL